MKKPTSVKTTIVPCHWSPGLCLLFILCSLELVFLLSLFGGGAYQKTPSADRQSYLYSSSLLKNFTFNEVNLSKFYEVYNTSNVMIEKTGSIYLNIKDYRLDSVHQYIAFPLGLTREEREVTLTLLQTFVQLCAVFEIPFFLYGGSLVGSLRHHDFIPWDDDVDVMLNSQDRAVLSHSLKYSIQGVQLHNPVNERWKLYWTKGKPIGKKQYRWPFIDIFFFRENSTHVYDELEVYKKDFCFPKSHVFPLCLRPFAGGMLPVPHNALAFAERNYNLSMCQSLKMSHKLEKNQLQHYTIPCRSLSHLYPFVHRNIVKGEVQERLVFRGRILSTVVLAGNCSAKKLDGYRSN